MKKEKKQEYTLRISRANKTELTIILYDMTLTYLQDCLEAYQQENIKEYQWNIDRAKECIDESYDGSLYYGENNGVVNYGFIKANDKTRYMWSSRAGVINCHVPTFKHCKESAINGFAADLTIDKINEILHEYYPGQYSVKRDINHPKEIRYIIVKR